MVQQEDLAAMGVITCRPYTPSLSLLDHAMGRCLEPTQNFAPIPPHATKCQSNAYTITTDVRVCAVHKPMQQGYARLLVFVKARHHTCVCSTYGTVNCQSTSRTGPSALCPTNKQ